MKWITINEYCRLNGISSPQIIYNKIYTHKLVKDKDWKEVEVTKKIKLIRND